MDLSSIQSPQDVKRLTPQEVQALLPQIRQRITEVVAQNGGHLASNLGVVELTVALHRVFDAPEDKFVFDVGHQSYAHKLLTGRGDRFETLRTFCGLSGFPKCDESEYDSYETGHASTALSAALGMARARDLLAGKEHVIAVVGDGAFTGGMCYEALNDAGSNKTRLILILNDNQMSIAPNVGALSNYLTYMRTSKGWLDIKKALSNFLLRVPLVGKALHRGMQRVKNNIRNIFIRDTFFGAMGFRYLGPIDGQDEPLLEKMLQRAKRFDEPVVLHVVTTKGAGYAPAEDAPDKMHGTPPFEIESGLPKSRSTARSFGHQAGQTIVELAEKDKTIVAVAAAMADSTGLGLFKQRFPKRLFDVGIAEEHAVTLAAGMARGGLRPVVAIYDTFMQRACDQMIVDVCLQNLPVVFIMDRAAIGGEDGPTHHGVFGTSWMRPIPNLTLLYPRCTDELDQMLRFAFQHDGPVAIRYPRAEGADQANYPYPGFTVGRWEVLAPGQDVALIAVGGMTDEALKVRTLLAEKHISAEVVNASTIKPLDHEYLLRLTARGLPYVVMEEQQRMGGLGSAVCENCALHGWPLPLHLFALEDTFVTHGGHEELLRHLMLDAGHMAQQITLLLEAPNEKQG